MPKFFITTPIYYPNARPHVGSAYTTIVCDAIARYKRMYGYDVAFLTGTDEHGEKLARAAAAVGMSPGDFVAEKRKLFTRLWEKLDIPAYNPEHPAGYRFVHTSQNPDHVKSVQWMIERAREAGYVEKKKYEGRYCIYDERYVSDSTEPANCDICGRPAELISEENWFFKLSAFQDRLLDLYKTQPDFVRPDFRMNEVKSFVKSGLRDISISRKRLKWGIPWPGDPDQVVYVWYDALTSYLTGIGFRGGDKPEPDFEKYWMDPEAERVHMIGKDILRFHAVYWPAFLMAANDALREEKRLPLPNTIFAHGWIYYEQDKMSKSKGNVVYPEPIVDALNSLGAPGNDALRYYLLRDTPFGQDASFSYDGLINRYNSDLANGLGNLTSRTLTMLRQFRGGSVPKPPTIAGQQEHFQLGSLTDSILEGLVTWNVSGVLDVTWDFLSAADNLIAQRKPWQLAKSSSARDQAGLDATLYALADLLRAVGFLLSPGLPEAAHKVWALFGGSGKPEDESLDRALAPNAPGAMFGKPEPIFPRLDKAAALARLQEYAEKDRGASETSKPTEKGTTLEQKSDATQPIAPVSSPATPSAEPSAVTDQKISIDDFAKVEMRVGEVKAAERIPNASKLLKLQVDIGSEIRQVCAGIAEYYEPEKLVGKKVVVVTNLQPRKLRGVESNGMIVAASAEPDGKPVLATFAEDVPNGARLK